MEKRFLTPAETSLALAAGAERITVQPLGATVILSILAGCYIAFGAQLATMVTFETAGHLGVGVSRLLGGSVFSVGLMLVVVCGAELFTGNILFTKSALHGRISWSAVTRSWAIVLAGNTVGALLMVGLMLLTDLSEVYGGHAVSIAAAKVKLGFTAAFTRGILCNWLVCLAVFMATAARDITGKLLSCYVPIMAFVASGFEHSIANLYFIPYGMTVNMLSPIPAAGLGLEALLANLVPVTLGNMVGGAVFVACAYWFVNLKGEATGV